MKKPLKSGTLETKKDAFIEYQRNLDAAGRMRYLQQLRKAAYGNKLSNPQDRKKTLISFHAGENESLEGFLKRVFAK